MKHKGRRKLPKVEMDWITLGGRPFEWSFGFSDWVIVVQFNTDEPPHYPKKDWSIRASIINRYTEEFKELWRIK
jgi:hypothetical protein